MDVLIIADFCGDFDGKGNFRFPYIAELLSANHNVELLTSDFNHAKKSHFKSINAYPFKITMLHEEAYPKNICIKRFYSHYKWGKAVKKYLNSRKKPDVIYCAVPTLAVAAFAGEYCKQNSIKFIVDVQDLWPEAFQMVFNIPVLSNIIFYPFKAIADRAYKCADAIVAVSDTYVKRVLKVNKNISSGDVIFLGTNLKDFDSFSESEYSIDKPDDEIWLAYCGTMAASYDIPLVIDSIKKLNNNKLRFIAMGDGPKRKDFESYAENSGINFWFTGNLPYSSMCSLLCKCDITVNPIVKGSAASIINKHADYAACCLPVLNTQESPEYRNLVNEFNMGFNCNNGDSDDLAEKLSILINDKDMRISMGENSRKCAENRFDRNFTYNRIEELITTI